MNENSTFLIVGLGLMGGSYAMGLTKKGYRVTAIDKNPASLAFALEHGLIAEGADTGSPAAPAALLARADVIVLALYPKDILPWLREHLPYFKPGALVTDLVGVKTCFVPEAQSLLAGKHEFIPCHPMAGREVSGVENADDGIFKNANFLITPTAANTAAGVAFAHKFAETLGFARVTELTIQDHDQMIGYVSQLTHAIAVSLMNANADPRLPEVTGDSFRDLTRIADINAGLWSELFFANKSALVQEIDEFTACLEQLKACLETGDQAGLCRLFEQSSQRRRQFKKQ